MPTIRLDNISYGPNPFSIAQGGLFHYQFTVIFEDGTPPQTFTYEIFAMSPTNAVLQQWAMTLATNGQSSIDVRFATPLTQSGGQPFPFGDFRNKFKVTATGFPTYEEFFCSGGKVKPDCDPCKDPTCKK